jgi:transcriptional regulator with XRE-family HTH domain
MDADNMTTTTDFPTWLLRQLEINHLSQSELARRAGISNQTVSDYVNGKRRFYDKDVLASMARVFDLPEEEIFVIVGTFKPKTDDDSTLRQIDHLYNTLRDPASKAKALEYLKFLKTQERQSSYEPKSKPKPK